MGDIGAIYGRYIDDKICGGCMYDAWTIYGRHKIDTWTIYSRYGQYMDDVYRADMAIYGRHLDDVWTILGAIWTIQKKENDYKKTKTTNTQ